MSTLQLLLCFFCGIGAIYGFHMSSKIAGRRISSSTLRMGIADRFFRVVKSNVNSLLSGLEDPELIINQALDDMQKDLLKIRESYADVSGALKRMEKQRETATSLADEWYKRAQLALSKNDEELAREALSRRQIQIVVIEDLDKALVNQRVAVEKLQTSMTMLNSKIQESQRQKDNFIARARTAKTSVEVNDMLNGLASGTNSMSAFERMKVKVESLESQAEVAGELASSTSGGTSPNMEEKFRLLEGSSAIDQELEQMKRMLPGSSSRPPSATQD